jgi:hypothetical protein
MVQKHIIISMIAPVAIAGILIMAILANQAYSSSGSLTSVKCKITKHGHTKCKTKTITPPPQGATSQQSSSTGNGATSQQSSSTGNGRTNVLVHNPPTSSQQSSNAGNAAQGASTGAKPTSLTLYHSFYQHCCILSGTLTSEGSGVGGATITLSGSAGVPTLTTTTASSGGFRFDFKDGLTRGSHTFEAHFAGNSEYASSSVTKQFSVAYT